MAEELHSAASSGHAVVSALTGAAWLGQASVSMASSTAPYLAWLSATAALAEQTAAQLAAAASAFEAAFAATVPLPVIAANRALLLALTATNVLGVNTPAIATVEAHYGEMWAQDAVAMYGYAGASAAASTLTPFAPPTEVADPTGLAGLAAAVPQALQQLASPASAGASTMSSSMSAMSSLTSVVNTLGYRGGVGRGCTGNGRKAFRGIRRPSIDGVGRVGQVHVYRAAVHASELGHHGYDRHPGHIAIARHGQGSGGRAAGESKHVERTPHCWTVLPRRERRQWRDDAGRRTADRDAASGVRGVGRRVL
jgi:hypothetical protein